jgi:predicted aspartyl protease
MLIAKGSRSLRELGMQSLMGITHVEGHVVRTDGNGPRLPVRFLVDSGATYSALPEPLWQQLSLTPRREVDLSLADGSIITRGLSQCEFEIAGVVMASPVILGRADEGPIVGAVTLETLGLVLQPLSRQLVPMRLLLARATAA